MHFFRIISLLDVDFLSSIKHPSAECWHGHVVLLLTLSQTSPGFHMSAVKVWKTLGKGEIACKEQFLIFLQHFLPF